MKHIVLVDHDELIRDLYLAALEPHFEVSLANSAQSAIDAMDKNDPHLLITDTMLNRHNGIEVIHEMRGYDDWLDVPILILSSMHEKDFPVGRKTWAKYGVVDFLYKPKTSPSDLLKFAKQHVI